MTTLYEALQQGARAEIAEKGAQNIPLVSTGMACPKCTHAEVPLMQNPANRNFYCSGPTRHEFRDTEELQQHGPKRLSNAPPPKIAVQPNHVSIQISLPAALVDQLNARFGVKLSACAGAVLAALVQPGSYVVSAEDSERLKSLLGPVKDGGALYGAVFSLHKDKGALQATLDDINRGVSPQVAMGGELMAEVDIETRRALEEKARGAGKPLGKYLGENIAFAVKNAWF